MSEIKQRLYRSRSERWLAGVCGGIGEYFNTDPTIIRVIFVLAAFIVGGGLLIYLVLWLIIPLEPEVFDVPVDVPEAEEE
jgi:phage shock protein C